MSEVVFLTIKLALLTTLSLVVLATPLAWWLARTRSWLKIPLSALVTLPIVLPPTVLGFYILVLLAPDGWIGVWTHQYGFGPRAFSFSGLLFGSIIYSLPFAVQPLQNSFQAMGTRPLEVAATLGLNPWRRFFKVALPLAKPGYISAMVLVFAHTLGEFGVILMIGGNIPGRTKVISTAIYDYVEMLQYDKAHLLAAGLLLFSFVIMVSLYTFQRRNERPWTR
ncbi:molybdate ABC transporter permease subunit [Bdellovibrio sp.]|uniref:molybdate ABC transporter permease subunit n=1 Tax=Bdellovibrio sp. TaxID=28201 RepID=UPI0039E38670